MKYRSKQEVIAEQLPKEHDEPFTGFLAEVNKRGQIEKITDGYVIHDYIDGEDEAQFGLFGNYVVLGIAGDLTVVNKEAFENSFELVE